MVHPVGIYVPRISPSSCRLCQNGDQQHRALQTVICVWSCESGNYSVSICMLSNNYCCEQYRITLCETAVVFLTENRIYCGYLWMYTWTAVGLQPSDIQLDCNIGGRSFSIPNDYIGTLPVVLHVFYKNAISVLVISHISWAIIWNLMTADLMTILISGMFWTVVN